MKQVFESDRIRFVEVSELLVPDYLVMVNDVEHVDRFIGGWHEPFTEEQEIRWVREKLREKANVEFVLNATVTGLLGGDSLTGIEITDKLTQEKKELPVDGLFVAIGQMPDNQAFRELAELDPAGYIAAGEDCRTKTAGIFTAAPR